MTWSRTSAWVIVILAVSFHTCTGIWYGIKKTPKGDTTAGERCFCQLKGVIDDCSCSVETLDSFNNLKLYPRLNSLLQYDYFRYWKVSNWPEYHVWNCTNTEELFEDFVKGFPKSRVWANVAG
ncbi:ERO1-like protein alpha [Penaeus indicus]|uniref:ERO1-like protein alpha n=1 Tax=Penaeus indicus TaxID=29960 RepID=UPI00300C2C09